MNRDSGQYRDVSREEARPARSLLATVVLKTPIWRAACWLLGVIAVGIYCVAAFTDALIAQVVAGFAIGFVFAALIARERSKIDFDP